MHKIILILVTLLSIFDMSVHVSASRTLTSKGAGQTKGKGGKKNLPPSSKTPKGMTAEWQEKLIQKKKAKLEALKKKIAEMKAKAAKKQEKKPKKKPAPRPQPKAVKKPNPKPQPKKKPAPRPQPKAVKKPNPKPQPKKKPAPRPQPKAVKKHSNNSKKKSLPAKAHKKSQKNGLKTRKVDRENKLTREQIKRREQKAVRRAKEKEEPKLTREQIERRERKAARKEAEAQSEAQGIPSGPIPRPKGWDQIIWGDYARESGKAMTDSSSGVYSTYHYYSPGYYIGSTFCADRIWAEYGENNKDLVKYPWVAYCATGHLGPMNVDRCGKCLLITNPSTGQSVKVRVMDKCGNGGLDMDPVAFNAIDGDNNGYLDGHMRTKIHFVSC
jgi:hypothetical protein